MSVSSLLRARSVRPTTADDLREWTWLYTGVTFASKRVCPEHTPPMEAFASWCLNPPPQSLTIGPRGGGKSFGSAISAHMRSRFEPRHGCRILGGSLAQSGQIHEAIQQAVVDGVGPLGWSDADTIRTRTQQQTRYVNGSEIRVLAASPKSVRGPHVQDLRLDEIDEMDPDIMSSAIGMAMDRARVGRLPNGLWGRTGEVSPCSVTMTSTWHRPDGPVGKIQDQAAEANERQPGSYPVFRFCSFCVLERCPDSLSGPNLERCPACPLVQWCHDVPDGGPPRAKRGNGHYTVRSLCQKAQSVSARMFEADYLCRKPKLEGLYFPSFDERVGGKHVPADDPTGWNEAEYRPHLPVHYAMDPGNHTGGVWFQTLEGRTPFGDPVTNVWVFSDFYVDNHPGGAESVARDIVEVARQRCRGLMHHRYIDPAGDSRTMIGSTALAEYQRGGLSGFRKWSKEKGSVQEGLLLIEGLLGAAGGHVALKIHPRCKRLIAALQNFRRKKLPNSAVYVDEPEDPQHPHEDLVEALRGGLRMVFPLGRSELKGMRKIHPGRIVT